MNQKKQSETLSNELDKDNFLDLPNHLPKSVIYIYSVQNLIFGLQID